MCGSTPSTLDVIDPIGVFHKGGVAKKGGLLNPAAPKFNLKKPPKPIDPTADLSLAQQHAKEAAIGAYGYSDTNLTGGKGLGSTPGNLWKTLGGSS